MPDESQQNASTPVSEPLRQPRFRAAYESLLPEIMKVSREDFLGVNLEIPAAVTTVLGAISEIKKMREECAEHLPKFDLMVFERIEPLARAMGYAHSRHKAASLPTMPLQELSERVVDVREILALDWSAMARRGMVDGKRLAELKGTTGFKNQAFDLLTLVAMMREVWPRIQGKTAVTAPELDDAESLADQLLIAVGEREQLPAVTAATADVRQAAYTLFLRSYDELRRAAEYLRWHEGTADALVPSLYAGKKRKGSEVKAAAQEPQPAPAAEAPAQPAPLPKNGGAPVGMPGSDPFAAA